MAKLESKNPAEGFKVIGNVDISTQEDVRLAVKKAKIASKGWGDKTVSERVSILRKVYFALKAKENEISEMATKEMGFPQRDQKAFDMGDGFHYFKWHLDNAERYLADEVSFEDDKEIHKIVHEPYGVAAVIQPWNFPFCQWSWGVVPHLVAGNTVVFKHSEEVPLTAKLIADVISKTDLPDGVFNSILGKGEVGKFLINQDIDIVSFTGSYRVGHEIYKKSAEKFIKCVLELGGSAPGVVFADANIEESVEHVVALRFTNTGQSCDGLKRLIVEDGAYDEVVDLLVKKVEALKVGNPLEENTDIGPLVSKKQMDLLRDQFDSSVDAGARVITGGYLKDNYFKPAVLVDIKTDMRIWTEEVFGPVLPVVRFSDYNEAIKLANDTPFGLGGYVYTEDLVKAQRAARDIKTGMVSVNGVNYLCPHNPFGGYKKSGLGREFGRFGFDEITEVKVIAMNK